MSEPTATPSYRLKLPCADEGEFRGKLLQKYVARGIFVPSERPKPIGTRLKLKLEVRSGLVLVSGDGMVTAVTQPGGTTKPGMTVRLTALHADSIQFPLAPSSGAHPTSPPHGAAPHPMPRPPPPPPPPSAPAAAVPVPPPIPAATTPRGGGILGDLFDLDFPEARDPHQPAVPDEGVTATTDPAIPIPFELLQPEAVEAAPTPPPAERPPAPPPAAASGVAAGASASTRTGLPSRRALALLAAGVIAAGAVAAAGIAWSRSARAAREASAKLDEQLRVADQRLLEGRLAGGGGDSALDRLLVAKRLAPDDVRVQTRLKLLADKFEQLGDRALARKNPREASVHLEAALAADPSRAKARAKLDGIDASARRPAGSR